MSRLVEVELNKANALIALGSLYRNAGDAIKEYVSNALDEWQRARADEGASGPCEVGFKLAKDSITIGYNSPGMDEGEFEEALKRVVDSPKAGAAIPQIGYLGIGLWAFNQIGAKAVFLSKRENAPTVKVVLRRHSHQAEFVKTEKGEEMGRPGMKIVISGLFQDPTKQYGPLSPERLRHSLAERFDAYVRSGELRITICCGGRALPVEALKVDLPKVGKGQYGSGSRSIRCELRFDPAGTGRVAVRHTGVVVIEDMKNLVEYGLEGTPFTNGYLRGSIDADFLTPLPARARFAENKDWEDFLSILRQIGPELDRELDAQHQKSESEKQEKIIRKAFRLAREVFTEDEFSDLELIAGLSRLAKRQTEENGRHNGSGNGHINGALQTTVSLNVEAAGHSGAANGGSIFQVTRPVGRTPSHRRQVVHARGVPFQGNLLKHSRVYDGVVEINTESPDYLAMMEGPKAQRVAYLAMMLGKEVIAHNEQKVPDDEALEKMLTYSLRVLRRTW